MKGKSILLSLSMLLSVMFFTAAAWGAGVGINVTGAPTTALQGETKTFTINVLASGAINLKHIPATVTVNTLYTADATTSGSPDISSSFSAPSQAPSCEVDKNGDCKTTQSVTGGPYAVGATVAIPADLLPGTYAITISASAAEGLTLPTPLPTFDIEVQAAGSAPSVSIIAPENGGSYKVNQPITAAVEINSALFLTSLTATLNSDDVSLTYNSDSANYEASLTLSKPGVNTFTVEACNANGCGNASSTFTVKYDFGAWLPPITTAKFQSGRTLPVKFTVSDYNGLTANALVSVKLDGNVQGEAGVFYENGLPYYQLEVKLDVSPGLHSISIAADDGVTSASKSITVK